MHLRVSLLLAAAAGAGTGAVLARPRVSNGYSSGTVAVGGGRVFTTAYLTAVLAYAPRPGIR